ncbi:MAG: SEL1-like repeat protein, partial [Burkholderiaceae bacterium]|nr:SEL1-like repeat protein [Burkholderiaceae bacterium]
DPFGRALLGVMLREGLGGAPDKSRSFALLQLANTYSKLNAFAQYQLGVSYEKGAGTPASRELAIAQYKLAAANGLQMAVKRLDQLGIKN